MKPIISIRPANEGSEIPALKRHPYLTAQVYATIGDDVIGAIALYGNPCIRYQDAATMLFGDIRLPAAQPELIIELLQRAAEEALGAGKRFLLGPINGSTWQDYRLPLDGSGAMFAGDNQHSSTLAGLISGAGFIIADTYRSSIAELSEQPPTDAIPGIIFRTITASSLSDDLRSLYPLCMNAFAQAPYFSPLTEAAFIQQYEGARGLLEHGLSFIAIHGEAAAGFVLAYPDQTDPLRKAVIIKTIARHPDRPIPGLTQSMVNTVYHAARQSGYTKAIHAFMHESNRSVLRSEAFGGKPLRRYAVFVKSLQGNE